DLIGLEPEYDAVEPDALGTAVCVIERNDAFAPGIFGRLALERAPQQSQGNVGDAGRAADDDEQRLGVLRANLRAKRQERAQEQDAGHGEEASYVRHDTPPQNAHAA